MSIRFPLKTEIALAADLTADPSTWAWTDISAYCYVRTGGFASRRGRGDWTTQTPPSSFALLLDNRDGRFSRLNPTGPYYGQLRKNTPVRVSANPGSGYVVRATGHVSEWPVEWDLSQTDYTVPVRADDVLRRLQQGTMPSHSALARVHLSPTYRPVLAGYWSCEDGPQSAVAAEASGRAPLAPVGAVEFGVTSGVPAGSEAAAGVVSARLTVTSIGRSDDFDPSLKVGGVRFDAQVQASGVRIATVVLSNAITLYVVSGTTTTLVRADTGATVHSVSADTTDGDWHTFVLNVEVIAGDLVAQLDIDDASPSSGSLATATMGYVSALTFNPLASADMLAVMHVAVTDAIRAAMFLDYVTGNVGQKASQRWSELCTFAEIFHDYMGQEESETVPDYPMGPDRPSNVFDSMQQCVDACAGVMYATRGGVLRLDTVQDRENVQPTLVLDYAQRHIPPPFAAVDDDHLTRNDVTVTLPDGSSARVVDDTGPMGVDTIGRYDTQLSRNVLTVDAGLQHAGWQVNLGTVNEYRFPSVNLKLHSPALASLLDDIVAVDIGSRVTIDNLPATLPPDLVDLIVEGVNERIDNHIWDLELVCAPYKPYKVGEYADATGDTNEWLGRYAGDDDAALRVAVDDNDVSLLIDPNRTRFITSAADADSFDPDITFRLGGEQVTVSAITTTAGTFVAAGAMSSADNAAVTPAMYAGATALDLILVVAGIRSASTGTISMPADYTRLPIDGLDASSPLQVWAKVHDGAEPDPTVTPADGAAGDTVSAVTLGFRGMPGTLDDLADIVVMSAGQSNASAQNIAYPGLYPRLQDGCVILAIGRKDDDWTSVAALSGFTEAVDSSTTTGNDQGLVVDYQIQTTPALIPEGSFTVTGGAAAVSEGAVLALAAGFQTFTVSARSVNGVVKSHTAGTKIEVETHVAAL